MSFAMIQVCFYEFGVCFDVSRMRLGDASVFFLIVDKGVLMNQGCLGVPGMSFKDLAVTLWRVYVLLIRVYLLMFHVRSLVIRVCLLPFWFIIFDHADVSFDVTGICFGDTGICFDGTGECFDRGCVCFGATGMFFNDAGISLKLQVRIFIIQVNVLTDVACICFDDPDVSVDLTGVCFDDPCVHFDVTGKCFVYSDYLLILQACVLMTQVYILMYMCVV